MTEGGIVNFESNFSTRKKVIFQSARSKGIGIPAARTRSTV